MKLTKLDLARLRSYQRARERAPTVFHGVWHAKWQIFILGILAVVACLIPGPPSIKYFVLGFTTGGLYCACVFGVIFQRFWPLTREVLNWEKVEQLLKEHDEIT
jgi:hypothetical protein